MSEQEADLHKRITEAVRLHQGCGWSQIKACAKAGIARKTYTTYCSCDEGLII
jgi:predicted DNA-binding protein (UPF0251 family)